MLPGVFCAHKKNGTVYFRAGITYRNKHISLGSYDDELRAHQAYLEADLILRDPSRSLVAYHSKESPLAFDKVVVLFNFRDHGLYIKTPIYLRESFFEYWFSPALILKFDIDDLFYYSSHKIQKRGGHLFVSDYGSQVSLLSRYGIKAYAIPGKDFDFANGDDTDFRFSNIVIRNAYYGVEDISTPLSPAYKTRIHIRGNFVIGEYKDAVTAAIAYNKAVDLAKDAGICKNYSQNYIEALSPRAYADIYSGIRISERYLSYLDKNVRTTDGISDTAQVV